MRPFLLSLVLLTAFSSLSAQTIHYVNQNNPTPDDGLSWNGAYTDLQQGIDNAAAGDTVWVATGYYLSTGNSYAMKSGVVLLGGFSGTETDAFQRNYEINTVTITGSNNPAISNTNIDGTAVLDGFTISGQNYNTNVAGILNISSSPIIRNCNFNGSTGGGGDGVAIDNESASSPKINNCFFSNNAYFNGAAATIENNASSPVIANCTFISNSGNAINNDNSASPIIANCVFWSNYGDIGSADVTGTPVITYCYTQTSIPGTGNIQSTLNPFVNINTNELAVLPLSVLADRGTPDTTGLGLSSTDITGAPRIQGAGISMGAYEVAAKHLVYVNQNNSSGNNTGTSWDSAFNSLDAPMALTSAGDTIWVATGTYSPVANSYAMKNGVVVLGGFNGTETTASQRNWGANVAVLYSNNNPVIVNNNIDSTALLDGFSFQGSNGNGGAAAIFNTTSSPAIQHCYFQTSVSDHTGSTIDNESGSFPRMNDCFFYNNNSGLGGSTLIENNASSPVFTNCVFNSNEGPVNNENFAAPVFTNCTFSNGSSTAITNETNAAATITNCVFWGNGGDILNDGSSTSTVRHSYTQTAISGTGNIQGSVNPFINDGFIVGNDGIPMTGDDGLALAAGSTAIDAGTPDTTGLYLPATDIAGNPRIGFGRIDMGAYEVNPITKLYVDAFNGSDVNSGAYWSQSLLTLNQALLLANADTVIKAIYMTGGDYIATGNADSAYTIYRGGLRIYGGYPSGGGTRDVINNATYLQGNNTNHVLVIAGIDANADSIIVDGITIQYGNASGTGTYTYNGIPIDQNKGGGIVIVVAGTSAKLIFNGCTINSNQAVDGGGIYVYGSIPVFTNCLISGNLATENGGGLYQSNAYSGELNCTFSGNNAIDSGGAIYNDVNAFSVIVNNIIWGNSSGVSDNSSSSIVQNSVTQDVQYAGGAGNVSSDPFFVNAPVFTTAPFISGNYHLSVCKISPAYNSGDSADFTQYFSNGDIENNPRISLGTIDMGAYEIQATPVNALTAVYVDSANGSDANLGDSWAHAFQTLGYALNQTVNVSCTDSILVAKGTYYPTGVQSGIDRHTYFTISRSNIKLLGGYDAATGQRDITNNTTYLDGDIGVAGDSTDNSYHVMIIIANNNSNDSIIVDGFTIRNGNANVIGDDEFHAGSIYRSDYGGGINLNSISTPTVISNCIFTHNNSVNGGGGSDFENSTISLLNTTYINNTSSRGAGYYAFNGAGQLVSGCTFTSNYTTAGGDGGAGMYCFNGYNFRMIDCIFNGNYAATNGGGVYMLNVFGPRILNCLFSGNVAELSGGGMYGGAQPALNRIVNCTFSGNKAATAGAVYVGNSGSLIMSSCVLYGNSSSMDNTATSVESSDVEGGYSGTGFNNLNIDPLFIDAPSYTTAPFTNGNYKLQGCSPVIEKGNSQYAGENGVFFADTAKHDLAGSTRLIGQTYDIGAYEFNPTGLPLPTIPGIYQSTLSMTDENNITHFYSCGNLLLSMNLTASGAVIPNDGVKVQVGTGATYYPDGTGFVNNASGTVLYNRQWQVTPTVEPSNPVTVYDYYTLDDYNNVNDTLAAHALNPLLAETQMYFYKVTDNGLGDFPAIETTSPSTVQIITNSTTPSLNTWVNGTAGNNKYGAFMVSSFSGGGGGGNPPMILAVQLLSFTGKATADYNALNWTVAGTKDVVYFEVERSSNGADFTTIGNAAASILQTSYSYNDLQPLQGNNYYRIKIVAANGSSSYSKIVKLNAVQSGKVTAYPIPAINTVTITNTKAALNGLPVNVMDMQGRIVFRFILNSSNTIDVSRLAEGVYNLSLADGETVRIIKAAP